MVAQGEGRSPMTSSDAETDSKPIIIIIIKKLPYKLKPIQIKLLKTDHHLLIVLLWKMFMYKNGCR